MSKVFLFEKHRVQDLKRRTANSPPRGERATKWRGGCSGKTENWGEPSPPLAWFPPPAEGNYFQPRGIKMWCARLGNGIFIIYRYYFLSKSIHFPCHVLHQYQIFLIHVFPTISYIRRVFYHIRIYYRDSIHQFR